MHYLSYWFTLWPTQICFSKIITLHGTLPKLSYFKHDAKTMKFNPSNWDIIWNWCWKEYKMHKMNLNNILYIFRSLLKKKYRKQQLQGFCYQFSTLSRNSPLDSDLDFNIFTFKHIKIFFFLKAHCSSVCIFKDIVLLKVNLLPLPHAFAGSDCLSSWFTLYYLLPLYHQPWQAPLSLQ